MALALVAMLVTMFVGLPIAFAVAWAGIVYFFQAHVSFVLFAQQLSGQLSSVPLLAIPFFVLAGELMNQGGITHRLFNFAMALVGRVPGAMGHANIVASMVFSGISGSAVADVASLGRVEIMAMRHHRYPADMTVAVTVASSTTGPIIPPSINAVIFGGIAAVPVGPLFLGGVVPGILAGLAMMITFAIIFRLRKVQPLEPDQVGLWRTMREASGAILMPVLLLGSMFAGVATPTEAAVLACVYAGVLSAFVYRELTLAGLFACCVRTATLSGAVMLIIGLAAPLGYIVARERLAADFTVYLLQAVSDPSLFMIVVLLCLLIAGTILEVSAAIILLTPLIYPAMRTLGFDPVHIGMVIIFGLGIGLITPPVGMCLFVGSQVSGLSMHTIAKASIPYVVALIAVLFLLAFFPPLVTWLPDLVYGRQ